MLYLSKCSIKRRSNTKMETYSVDAPLYTNTIRSEYVTTSQGLCAAVNLCTTHTDIHTQTSAHTQCLNNVKQTNCGFVRISTTRSNGVTYTCYNLRVGPVSTAKTRVHHHGQNIWVPFVHCALQLVSEAGLQGVNPCHKPAGERDKGEEGQTGLR